MFLSIPSLGFTSGPATVVDPSHIDLLDDAPKDKDELKVHQVSDDHRVYMQGEFGGFHLYLITNHTRFEISRGSTQRLSDTHFKAEIRMGTTEEDRSSAEIAFRSPLTPFSDVGECIYGRVPDAFQFYLHGGRKQRFPCDLTFMTQYAENAPKIPLEVMYIGIAQKNGRQAHHRLGEGHEKLQKILANESRRGGGRATSLALYRPSELKPPLLNFSEVVETIEASLIQHFQTHPLNVEHLNFPKNDTKLVRRIKEAGARMITVTVTAPKGTTLYSQNVEAREVHDILLHLQ